MEEASEIEPVDLWRFSEPEPTGLARRFLFRRWAKWSVVSLRHCHHVRRAVERRRARPLVVVWYSHQSIRDSTQTAAFPWFGSLLVETCVLCCCCCPCGLNGPDSATTRDCSLMATPASPCPRPDGLGSIWPRRTGDQMINPRAPKLCGKQPNGRISVALGSQERALSTKGCQDLLGRVGSRNRGSNKFTSFAKVFF
ncbi:hypothetical protein SETIT_8G029900v2 [Setaria italica]|uniref:Uncharacterized protein n=1 Tax=Setaria italica TaxID=4555 RepID=A0A368S3X3_SETIT|nr:hypothetical protein SETIT_8G029900v2 [Setaria italica]RCV37034.1 hypothetical protein SETIT_8G029900v2 [Setaria italica]